MQKRNLRDDGRPLPPHFVIYDYDDPSPLFTPEQVALIESIRSDFDDKDLARIHALEEWVLNTNTGWLNSPAIPGLRPTATRGTRYVRRFGTDPFTLMIRTFLDPIRYAFSTGKPPCSFTMLRIALPNGKKFYPVDYHTDVTRWERLLDEAAAACGTDLARFDRGKFILSNGDMLPISALSIEQTKYDARPEDW